jgi:cytoskeleton protein RodZ
MNDEKRILGLAAVRRNRGISLQQISDVTKIGVRSLEAIEHGDFRKLPGGIYTTSYIRQYARAIDYNADLILECYRRTVSDESAPPRAAKPDKVYSGFRPASTPVGS